jgi:Zn-dependent M28 family amino/carboxypeptidase
MDSGHGLPYRGTMKLFGSGAVPLSVVAILLTSFIPGCAQRKDSKKTDDVPNAKINAEDLLRHVKTLSADEFEGRAPGTKGEELTVAYLTKAFRDAGLRPGNPDGTFVQRVPLVGSTARDVRVSFRIKEQTFDLSFPTQAVVWTKRFVPEISVENSEMVFVGYGVVAPEYGWDDFKGIDVRGKTIVFLVNDPAIPDPRDASKLDDNMFKGRAMTYYGRWTYKFEIAAERGAAAAIIVHETGPAGYPWAVPMGSNSRENFDLQTADRNMGRAAIEGWIHLDQARELFASAGQDFDELKRMALSKEFRPIPLGAANFHLKNMTREVASQNVIAKVEGSDPKLKGEYVIYTAHWDHLGRDTTLKGDQIFNGARDNGTGCAALLEIAGQFARTKSAPKRTVLFLAVTAEEKGLLGAKHYAAHPLYPINGTVANINMDNMNPWGRTRDINVVGLGQTTLEDVLGNAAAVRGRVLTPDSEPEKGLYFRSDHFEFAKVGVPGLYTHSGADFIGKPASFGREKIEGYTAKDYHKVSDEIQTDWDFSGLAEDAELLFEVGWKVANDARYPAWKHGSEFRKLRPGE